MFEDKIQKNLRETINVKERIMNDKSIINLIETIALEISSTLKNGGKIIICGNGGSASDALHFAGEIVGRFQKERRPWPALVLNADVATMTAISNDYGYDAIYSRQVKAFAQKNDILIGISTSGNSTNVINAIKECKKIRCKTVCMLGKGGGLLKDKADYSIVIPSDVTSRIQESHICLIHIICELVEDILDE